MEPFNRFLLAIYDCEDGYSLEHPLEDRLFCSHHQWIGNTPVCIPEGADGEGHETPGKYFTLIRLLK